MTSGTSTSVGNVVLCMSFLVVASGATVAAAFLMSMCLDASRALKVTTSRTVLCDTFEKQAWMGR
ncbi:MAG: hypothetical protein NVSMB42_05940 [Herpetosiphon sp.]